jgi:hypothetical protein
MLASEGACPREARRIGGTAGSLGGQGDRVIEAIPLLEALFMLRDDERTASWFRGRAARVLALALSAGTLLVGSACEQEPVDEPRGGGYREDPPENTEKPRAKSALGKAKEAAERLVDEDIAEYNRKLEEAADGKFE